MLLYALCVLGWNRWTMSKYTATETKEREEEAEVYPMLHKDDDIPFGARALERGIGVEGIWVSDPNTPTQSPVPSRPASPVPRSLHETVDTPSSSVESQSSLINPKPMPLAARREVIPELNPASAGFTYENQRLSALYRRSSPLNLNAMRISPAREESLIGMKDTTVKEKRASFHTRIFGTTSNPDTKDYRVGLDGADDGMKYVPAIGESHSPESKRGSRAMSKSNLPRCRD